MGGVMGYRRVQQAAVAILNGSNKGEEAERLRDRRRGGRRELGRSKGVRRSKECCNGL
jgi:hypothetical protein